MALRKVILDDRGVRYRGTKCLVPLGLVPPPDDPRSPMPQAGKWAYWVLPLGSLVAMITLFIGLSYTGNLLASWPAYMVLLGSIGLFGVGAIFNLVLTSKHVVPVMVHRMVLDRRCPSCTAPLVGSPQSDGCTECEKCGAAWRVPTPAELTTRPCPTCDYELIGLQPDSTLRIRCPECGEAWYFGDG